MYIWEMFVDQRMFIYLFIWAADGFVVQTGDPEGPAEGFIDPSTEKVRTVPLEIMVAGKKTPFYGSTLEVPHPSPKHVYSYFIIIVILTFVHMVG